MKITFLGATNSVTGSKTLVTVNNKNILVDCGLYQGIGAEDYNKSDTDILGKYQIDAIILTHAHLDHSGLTPWIIKYTPKKIPIFATSATKDVAEIILNDNARIQSAQTKKLNKKITKEKEKTLSLYDQTHVLMTMAAFTTCQPDHALSWNGISLSFISAGHILGASSVKIEFEKKEILFTGDLGRDDDLTMYPPNLAHNLTQNLVCEATYGDRLHSEGDGTNELISCLKTALKNKAPLLIPTFAVGRSQMILFVLNQILHKHPELKIPIIIDSPMIQAVFALYYKYPDQHKIPVAVLRKIEEKFTFIEHLKEREKIHYDASLVIISASGMLSGGHVVEHFSNIKDNPKAQIALVGFQSPGTLGHEIQNPAQGTEIMAMVSNIKQFSSHADQNGLINWCTHSNAKNIFLTHGEEKSKEVLKVELEKLNIAKVTIPRLEESFEL